MFSPTRFACEAMGLRPAGRPWTGTEPIPCTLEGVPIQPGDPVDAWLPGPNFTDDVDLAARSGVISGWASVFMRKPVMTKTQRVVFTREGAFSLAKDNDRAWLLLTPPAPPWLAVIGDSTLQHLVWRTPPTLDNRLMFIRLGKETVFRIRPDLVKEALSRIAHQRTLDPNFHHGFVSLDRDAKDLSHGVIRHDTPAELAAFFSTLCAGEIWALSILAKANPPTPILPERVVVSTNH